MGKLLSKLDKLFTPTATTFFINPFITTATTTVSCPSSSASSCSSSLDCCGLMGSLLAALRRPKDVGSSVGAGGGGGRIVLPFDQLPQICKLNVFSFLDVNQRGIAAQVCHEWYDLVHEPDLWSVVDLTQISSSHVTESCRLRQRHRSRSGSGGQSSSGRGNGGSRGGDMTYERRVSSYLSLLADIRAPVHQLSFIYDICSNHNRFLECLSSFLSVAYTSDLTSATLIWNKSITDISTRDTTAPLPASTDVANLPVPVQSSPSFELLTDDRQRARQRLFVQFFQSFVRYAPNIRHLDLPFDWSLRSVGNLSSLVHLRTLSLSHYFDCGPCLDQVLLTKLLAALPRLNSLTLEVWSASGTGLLPYALRSDSLEHLDVSGCRGFVMSEIIMPRLRSLRVARRPWCGPLECCVLTNDNISCLHSVLTAGAPSLESVNGYILPEDWRDGLDAQLDRLLKDTCACPGHYYPHGSTQVLVAVQVYGVPAHGVVFK